MIYVSVYTTDRLHSFQLQEELPWALKTAKRVLDSSEGEGGNTLVVGQKYQKT